MKTTLSKEDIILNYKNVDLFKEDLKFLKEKNEMVLRQIAHVEHKIEVYEYVNDVYNGYPVHVGLNGVGCCHNGRWTWWYLNAHNKTTWGLYLYSSDDCDKSKLGVFNEKWLGANIESAEKCKEISLRWVVDGVIDVQTKQE